MKLIGKPSPYFWIIIVPLLFLSTLSIFLLPSLVLANQPPEFPADPGGFGSFPCAVFSSWTPTFFAVLATILWLIALIRFQNAAGHFYEKMNSIKFTLIATLLASVLALVAKNLDYWIARFIFKNQAGC